MIIIPGQKTKPYNNQQKKKICKIVDFAIPADHIISLTECEKKDKCLDLARELKKLWNIVVVLLAEKGSYTKEVLAVLGLQSVCLSVKCLVRNEKLSTPSELARRICLGWTSPSLGLW